MAARPSLVTRETGTEATGMEATRTAKAEEKMAMDMDVVVRAAEAKPASKPATAPPKAGCCLVM